jgi:hypothetical protein
LDIFLFPPWFLPPLPFILSFPSSALSALISSFHSSFPLSLSFPLTLFAWGSKFLIYSVCSKSSRTIGSTSMYFTYKYGLRCVMKSVTRCSQSIEDYRYLANIDRLISHRVSLLIFNDVYVICKRMIYVLCRNFCPYSSIVLFNGGISIYFSQII